MGKNDPNVAKAGGLQSQGVKGEAVIGYRDPLITRVADPVEDGNLKSSSFPERRLNCPIDTTLGIFDFALFFQPKSNIVYFSLIISRRLHQCGDIHTPV